METTLPTAASTLALSACFGAADAGSIQRLVADTEAKPVPGVVELVESATASRRRSGAARAEVRADAAGPIGPGCRVGASMRGRVCVSGTPLKAAAPLDLSPHRRRG